MQTVILTDITNKRKASDSAGSGTGGDSLSDLPVFDDQKGSKVGGARGGGAKKRLSVERIYQKKSQHEHILLRPDTYIGSVERVTAVRRALCLACRLCALARACILKLALNQSYDCLASWYARM